MERMDEQEVVEIAGLGTKHTSLQVKPTPLLAPTEHDDQKALAIPSADQTHYVVGWRLHLLSLRSAIPENHDSQSH